jgi:hypothetical protein
MVSYLPDYFSLLFCRFEKGAYPDRDTLSWYNQRRELTRLAILPFTRLFISEGNLEYTGCNSTEHRGQRLEQRP